MNNVLETPLAPGPYPLDHYNGPSSYYRPRLLGVVPLWWKGYSYGAMKFLLKLVVCVALAAAPLFSSAAQWLEFEGKAGPGHGKHIVFLSGDEEYRSEQALPMLAKLLALRHGFKCTVLFPINPADGTIDPITLNNIPGMEALDSAQLCIMSLRFRELPDDQMKHFVDYLGRGGPIIALRTSTHAFSYERNKQSPFARFDWRNKDWPGGFGQQVLGETWVDHHGSHGKESTRGVINTNFAEHPLLRGVTDLWAPTDVYAVTHLPSDAKVLVWGQVLSGMNPGDAAVTGPKNEPMMPLVWIRNYAFDHAPLAKILTTTMGAAVDLQNESLRRLIVNGAYWATGLEQNINDHADVRYVGEYQPLWFGFGKFAKGVKPDDLALKDAP